MHRKMKLAVAFAFVALGATLAAQEVRVTTISVDDLHCEGCAKRVVKNVEAVKGVASAKADVKATTVTVSPQAQQAPSPREMWEAIEKAGFKPTKLVGPSGTFTEKPKT